MNDIERLSSIAKAVRRSVLDMTYHSGVNGGHLGGAFSSAEILATLYGSVMNICPDCISCDDRDRFILSKGHTAIAHYAVLAECGFISKDDLQSFEKPDSLFPTHEMINLEKGIEISSGSLGYGLSIAVGIALSGKTVGKKYRTFVLLGDGECNEGTVWEAAMAGSRFGLNKLVAIVDYNGQSLDGFTSEIMPINSIEEVWKGFGWNVIHVEDGNDIQALLVGFKALSDNQPNVIIAHTLKAKGIPSIEGKKGWHHVRLSTEQYVFLKNELESVK